MSTYNRAEVEAMLVEACCRAIADYGVVDGSASAEHFAAIAARILAAKAPEGACSCFVGLDAETAASARVHMEAGLIPHRNGCPRARDRGGR